MLDRRVVFSSAMANPLKYITAHPKETKRMLGVSYQDLQSFIVQAEQRHQDIQTQKEKSETRLIAKGGGRKASLSHSEQIVLTLTYLRQHLTFQMLGLLFDVSESTAHNIFNYWLPIFHDLLPESLFAQLQDQDSDWAFAQEVLEQNELIIDSSEQERERPTGSQEQEMYYSGYKKTYV
jgi:hypothetical protein